MLPDTVLASGRPVDAEQSVACSSSFNTNPHPEGLVSVFTKTAARIHVSYPTFIKGTRRSYDLAICISIDQSSRNRSLRISPPPRWQGFVGSTSQEIQTPASLGVGPITKELFRRRLRELTSCVFRWLQIHT